MQVETSSQSGLSFAPIDAFINSLVGLHARKEVMRMDDHSRSYGLTSALEVTSS